MRTSLPSSKRRRQIRLCQPAEAVQGLSKHFSLSFNIMKWRGRCDRQPASYRRLAGRLTCPPPSPPTPPSRPPTRETSANRLPPPSFIVFWPALLFVHTYYIK